MDSEIGDTSRTTSRLNAAWPAMDNTYEATYYASGSCSITHKLGIKNSQIRRTGKQICTSAMMYLHRFSDVRIRMSAAAAAHSRVRAAVQGVRAVTAMLGPPKQARRLPRLRHGRRRRHFALTCARSLRTASPQAVPAVAMARLTELSARRHTRTYIWPQEGVRLRRGSGRDGL